MTGKDPQWLIPPRTAEGDGQRQVWGGGRHFRRPIEVAVDPARTVVHDDLKHAFRPTRVRGWRSESSSITRTRLRFPDSRSSDSRRTAITLAPSSSNHAHALNAASCKQGSAVPTAVTPVGRAQLAWACDPNSPKQTTSSHRTTFVHRLAAACSSPRAASQRDG
jgi:hypothetical protein